MTKKKMTIDSFARMTAEQFAKVDERFDAEMKSTLKTVLDVVL
jgi:hypothetical protein